MKCVLCKNGDTQPGVSTITLEQGNTLVVFRSVPAQICNNCGEPYFDDDTVSRLMHIVEESARIGVQVVVRDYQYNAVEEETPSLPQQPLARAASCSFGNSKTCTERYE